jgi:hypothetical protein
MTLPTPLTIRALQKSIDKRLVTEAGLTDFNTQSELIRIADEGLLETVNLCRDYLSIFTPIRVTDESSYNLKHDVEYLCGGYVPNSAMVLAIIALDMPYSHDGTNACIGISKPEWRFAWAATRHNASTGHLPLRKPTGWDEFVAKHGKNP